MYGLIVKMKATPGRRQELIATLREATGQMPGCMAYLIAQDAADPDQIWITEAWEGKAAHAASLSLPEVLEAISKARPMIAAMERVAETVPVRL